MLNKIKIALVGSVMAAAMVSGSAHAASATATASVEILTPVVVTKVTDLDFGLIAVNGAGSVVVDEASAAKSCTGSVICVGTTGVLGAFTVLSAGAQTLSVSVSNAVLTDGIANTLRLSGAGVTGSGTNSGTYTSTAVAKAISVGGTITLAGTETAGVKTGSFTLTANYQ